MSRKSEEMPNKHESRDIESVIQNTDQIEKLPFSPADEMVSDSISSEGNCNCIWSISQKKVWESDWMYTINLDANGKLRLVTCHDSYIKELTLKRISICVIFSHIDNTQQN